MSKEIGRREMLTAAGAAVAAGTMGGTVSAQDASPQRKIIGISCSPRKNMTTAACVRICLAAAEQAEPLFTTEWIDLAELSIPAQVAAGVPAREGEKDDFPQLFDKLADPAVAGIIVGSPVYFGNMSALCKAFLDRCGAFRRDGFRLRNKVAGAVAIGSARNGGQELTVQAIQTALMFQDMIIVSDGQPTSRMGATFLNTNDSIEADEFGKETGNNLGGRVAELAAMLHDVTLKA